MPADVRLPAPIGNFTTIDTWQSLGIVTVGVSIAIGYVALVIKVLRDPELRGRLFESLYNSVRVLSRLTLSFLDVGGGSIEQVFKERLRAEQKIRAEGGFEGKSEQTYQVSLSQSEDPIHQLYFARQNIEAAYRSVSARGIVSLIAGVITGSAAIYEIQSLASGFDPSTLKDLTTNAILYICITRASLAVFVIFITYFFLSLYKRSLDEIKFYQNEMTNIQVWIACYVSAIKQPDDRDIKVNVINKMAGFDRNAIHQRGHSSEQVSNDDIIKLCKILIDKVS